MSAIAVVVLSGGSGTRVASLTGARPKALLQIGAAPLFVNHVARLSSMKCDVYLQVNEAHKYYESEVHYWSELLERKINILVTKGHISNALVQIGDLGYKTIFLINCDVISDIDYRSLFAEYSDLGVDLLTVGSNPLGEVGYLLDSAMSQFKHFGAHWSHSSSNLIGITLLNNGFLKKIGEAFAGDFWKTVGRLVNNTKTLEIAIREYDCKWRDVGTVLGFLNASFDSVYQNYSTRYLIERGLVRLDNNLNYLGPAVTLIPTAKVNRSVVAQGASILKGAVVEECVILPFAEVNADIPHYQMLFAPGTPPMNMGLLMQESSEFRLSQSTLPR